MTGHFAAFVHGQSASFHRTNRALANAGGIIQPRACELAGRCCDALVAVSACDASSQPRACELAEVLAAAEGIVGVAASGVWFPARRRVPELPAAGEWIGAGAWLGAVEWERALARCGGDFSRLPWWAKRPPAPPAMLFSPAAARRFGARLRELGSVEKTWRAMLRSSVRVVHLPEFDARFSGELRVLQVVTSIQIGGAERVALDLPAAAVVTLGRPLRETFPAPPRLVDLSSVRRDPEQLAAAIGKVALEFGVDAIHAHLIRAVEARAIAKLGLPLILHIHNFPAGWPPDYAELAPGDATLLAACAQSVEREVARLLPAMTVRTIWNGVPSGTPRRGDEASQLRPFTVVTLANPRLQKRLDRIPAIAREIADLLAPRRVRFVIAGAREAYSADSAEAIAALDSAIETHDARALVERPGLLGNPAELLAQADAMLSVSAYEGLSLAHLEALAAGVPLVATDAGGTSEIAAQSDAVTLLPLDASAAQFAAALASCHRGTATLPVSFSRHKMAARATWLAAAVVRRAARTKGDGLWLIANNFSTGGAQSSARRLLVALQERGIRVRAAVIQEQPEFPTVGRRALMDAGIPVIAVSHTDELLDAIERDPPQAVFFWNLIASWKVLLADALLDTRIFDISPGEMLFSSLARFFENPPTGLPYRTPADYAARLAGMVVKYHAEAPRAAELGCPVSVIRNGIPLLPPASDVQKERLVLGTAARLSPDKKLGDLLAAVRLAAPRLPPFVLRIAGGPERDFPEHAAELRRLADGLPVEWMGELADIRPFLQSLSIFLMISEPAGCPNGTLEAAAAGLPIIATHHGGAAEQVLHLVTGHLVPRGDVPAFAEALVALAHSPEKRAAMGQAGRDHIAKEFSISKMADGYLALIRGGYGPLVDCQRNPLPISFPEKTGEWVGRDSNPQPTP